MTLVFGVTVLNTKSTIVALKTDGAAKAILGDFIPGIFFGTITLVIINQGDFDTDCDHTWSSLISGLLLLLAVLMNSTFRKMALSYAPRKGAK